LPLRRARECGEPVRWPVERGVENTIRTVPARVSRRRRGRQRRPGHRGHCRRQRPFRTRLAVSRTIRAGENQRHALEQIRSTASTAADTLAVTCPKDIPAPLGQRLDKLGVALDAIAASLATMRPAFAAFYESLDDEQKARLAVIDLSRQSQAKADRDSRPASDARVLDIAGDVNKTRSAGNGSRPCAAGRSAGSKPT
jgi:hypothetical protein